MTEGWVHTHTWRGTDVALWEVITWFCGESDAFIRDALIYSVLCRGEAFDASVGRIMGQNRRVCVLVCVLDTRDVDVWKVGHIR